MISLLVSESYAFDYLSILQVKYERLNTKETRFQFFVCRDNIVNELGEDVFNKIFESEIYAELLQANHNVWDLVERAKNDNVTAKEVDYGNFVRWDCKNKLQSKFFNNKNYEVKNGYEKYKD